MRSDTWTSPGDFGDKRGKFTPDWWKLAGSQYGDLKRWRVTRRGHVSRRGTRCRTVTLDDLELNEHRSIRVRIGVKDDARHPGGHEHLRHGVSATTTRTSCCD